MAPEQAVNQNAGDAQPTLEQVRELLFGAEQRGLEAQIIQMRAEMAEMRRDMQAHLARIEQQLSAKLAAEKARSEQRHREASRILAEAAKAMEALADVHKP